MKAIVTGTIAYDILTHYQGRLADRLPRDEQSTVSVSFLVADQVKQYGGTAANVAYTLKLLGIEPFIVGAVGSDFGPYAAYLAKHGISTKHLLHLKSQQTSAYYAVSDRHGGQVGIFYAGAMGHNKQMLLEKATRQANIALITSEDPEATAAHVLECQKQDFPYIYNPGFNTMLLSPEVLRSGVNNASVLVVNDAELEAITNKLETTLEDICATVPVVIQTVGSKGSIVYAKGKAIAIPVATISHFKDPSGAGDAYMAGFAAGYLRKLDLVTSCRMGAVAAAYTVETQGTQVHTFTKAEFIKRYKENFGDTVQL